MPTDAMPRSPARSAASPRPTSSGRSARKRCADVDLNRWLSGVYVVPGKDEDDEDGATSPDDEDA